MIAYLVCAEDATGFAECEERGWQRIALNRFITEAKDDIRVISLSAHLAPVPGGTNMIKGRDYEEGPPCEPAHMIPLNRWIGTDGGRGEKEKFDEFVASGVGRWLDIDNLHPAPVIAEAKKEF